MTRIAVINNDGSVRVFIPNHLGVGIDIDEESEVLPDHYPLCTSSITRRNLTLTARLGRRGDGLQEISVLSSGSLEAKLEALGLAGTTAEDVHTAYAQGRRDAAKDTQAYTQGWAGGHDKAVSNAKNLPAQHPLPRGDDMSTLPGNPHVTEADLSTQVLHDWMEREGETDATMLATALDAQTQATLALAYEQRTASLIAYATARFADGSPMFPADIDGAREVIYARLGLDGGE